MPEAGTASATANYAAQVGAVHGLNVRDALNKSFDVINLRTSKALMVGEDLFETVNVAKPDLSANNTYDMKLSELTSSLDLPQRADDTSPYQYSQPWQGFDKTIRMKQYERSIRVTENLLKFDQSGKIMGMLQGLPNAFKSQKMYAMWNLFNNGFDTNVGADGMYMFDSARPSVDPRTANWSNLETAGALTAGRLATMRLNMENHVDEKGRPDPVSLTKLIVPTALAQKAWELTNSKADKDPESALNTSNWNQGAALTMVSHYLTSTTAWFGWGDKTGHERGLYYVTCYPITIRPLSSSEMNNKIPWGREGKVIFDVDMTVPRNAWGNAGG